MGKPIKKRPRRDPRQPAGALPWRFQRLLSLMPLATVMALIGVVLATIGFQDLRGSDGNVRDLLDSLYRAVQTLGLNFDTDPAWPPREPGYALLIGRCLTALATFTVVIELVTRRLNRSLRLLIQRARAADRVILLGFGSVNHAVAFSHGAGCLTAVDKDFDAADRRLADERGVLLVDADLRDRAAIECVGLTRCREIYVACGSDEANIQVAQMVAEILDAGLAGRTARRPEVFAHLSSVGFMHQLEDVRDLAADRSGGFATFSLKQEAARDLLARARLPQLAREQGRDQLHIVICGVGDQGEALLLELALGGHSAGMKPPRITVIDRDAAAIETHLTARYPELFDPGVLPPSVRAEACPVVEFRTEDIRSLRIRDLCALSQSGAPVSAFMIATSDDSVNMNTALRLETAMQRCRLPHARIFARQWEDVARLAPRATRPGLHVERFGNAAMTAAAWLGNRDRDEALARRLHAHYSGAPDSADALWADLAQLYRRANIRAVRHGASKLIDIGLQWKGMAEGELPQIDWTAFPDLGRALAEPLDADRPTDDPARDRLWDVAQSEHARWVVDRATNGFRPVPADETAAPGKGRSDVLRRHPLIVPFAALEAAESEIDLQLFKVLSATPDKDDPRSPAYLREVHTIEAGDTPIPCGAGAPTEVALHLADPFAVPGAADLARRIAVWSAEERACRLHLILDVPAQFPRLVRPDTFHDLDLLTAGLAPGIACDVSWRARMEDAGAC